MFHKDTFLFYNMVSPVFICLSTSILFYSKSTAFLNYLLYIICEVTRTIWPGEPSTICPETATLIKTLNSVYRNFVTDILILCCNSCVSAVEREYHISVMHSATFKHWQSVYSAGALTSNKAHAKKLCPQYWCWCDLNVFDCELVTLSVL